MRALSGPLVPAEFRCRSVGSFVGIPVDNERVLRLDRDAICGGGSHGSTEPCIRQASTLAPAGKHGSAVADELVCHQRYGDAASCS